jgi:hypothetical protein
MKSLAGKQLSLLVHFIWRTAGREPCKYIRNQQQHHAKRTYKEEFIEFLERYEIEYDDSCLWD